MTRIFTTLATLDALALVAAFAVGIVSRLQEGVGHPEDPIYLVHFILGLAAALGNLLVHCLILTYFLGTGRWVKEVSLAYGLPDAQLPRLTRDLKRRNTPRVLLAMSVTIATAAAGEGDQHQVWPWWIHLALAIATLGVNAWVFVVEYRNLRLNAGILDTVLREVDRLRILQGLPSNAEALTSEGRLRK